MNNLFHYTNFFKDTGIFHTLFEDVTYPWDVLSRIEDFIATFQKNEASSEYEERENNIFVGRNVTIDDTARIVGGAIIGHNATIGHAAFLRGGVLVGDGVNVGHATEVKHSIILPNTKLAHLNYVGDSIIGGDCNISGGATLANWRFDRKDIEIKDGDSRIPTHLNKLGGILGDGCFVGVSAVINPGTVLAPESLVFPLVSVSGTHLEQKKFK